MVPIPESSYFPPLDKCLNGELLILSWKTAFSAITNGGANGRDNPSAIQQFFSDPEVIERLSKPFEVFPEPSSQTKAVFEQKTSAINVTPSSNSRYDIKEIKEDSSWLSQVAKVDEVSALRIVVEECQSRTAAQLLGPFSEEELASIREASGSSKYSNSLPVSLLSQGADPVEVKAEFDSQDSRRQRIFGTYLSERRYLLKCVESLLHSSRAFDPQDSENGRGKGRELATSWLQSLSSTIEQRLGPGDGFLLRCFKAIKTNVKSIESGSGWFGEDSGREDIELEWVRSQIAEATHTMEIIYEIIDASETVTSSQVILEWLRLLQTSGFFNGLDMEEPSIQTLLLPLQSMTIIISLSVFSLGTCVSYLSDLDTEYEVSAAVPTHKPYILNSRTISEIHAMLLNAAEVCFATAGPALLAWSTLLQIIRMRVTQMKTVQMEGYPHNRHDRQGSVDADLTLTPVLYEDVMEQIMDSLDEDPIDFLALRAVNDCHVFETLSGLALRLGSTSSSLFSYIFGARMRLTILELIQNTAAVGYIPEVIEASISALTGGQNYWDNVDSKPLPKKSDPTTMFLDNEDLMASLLRNAMSRYPYEPIPFLRIIRALAGSSNIYGNEDSKSVLDILEPLAIFTYQLPEDFVDYETIQEEDNNNNIRLTYPVQLFGSRSKSLLFHGGPLALTNVDNDFCIPAGTAGRIISDSGPKVAFWFHEYSGLKYLGKLLETFLAASDQVDATTQMPADRDSVSEIIEILATLLLGISKSAGLNTNSKTDAMQVLETASSGLGRNRDIISVVFDIFEEELQKQVAYSGSDVPLDILVSCTHFIHALVSISPRRVWPLLAQSGLLGVGRGGARLPAIVESVELVSGRYDLLISCCRLYETLVEELATNTVRRKTVTKSKARYIDGEDVETGVPDQVLSKTLLSFARYLVDVLESSCTWKFTILDDRLRLTQTITASFRNILRYTYGIESPSEDASKKIMGTLVPAASHIVESFLSNTSGTLRFQPLLRSYYDGLDTPDFTAFLPLTALWRSHVIATLDFSQTLLRVSALLERPTSQLESQMFKSSPLIARLYAVDDIYQNPVILLFEALILSASNNPSEPPSLLGHLGPQTAKNFLHMLSDLDRPLSRENNALAIWHFLSIVVSGRQQWFANYLLTGNTPRDALQNRTTGKDLATLDKPLLTTALEKLSNIENISRPEALAMLEFVALAQNFWPWTVYGSQEHGDFIKGISEFIGTLKPIQPAAKLEAALDACYQTRIAAHIAEILAMHLFHARQTGTMSQINDLIPNLSYFARFAVGVPTYNSSLHGQLKINFEAQYGGCKLRDLKRTTLEGRQFGRDYFYDLPLAEKMLSLDQGWTGRADNGFRNEIALANVNLSLVDAQIALFQSWKFLAIELSSKLSTEVELQKMLAKVANDCLVANSRSQLPEDIFTRLSQTRADFALILTQRLIEAKSSVPETRGLLTTVWENIRVLRGSFDRDLQKDETAYYRSLLKLLFLSLRVHADNNISVNSENFHASLRMNQSATIIPTLLDILKYVIANGLRELASSIHDSAEDSAPEDVALLTGILQAILRVPGIELCHSQIVSLFSAQSTARIAITLFSWSDSLAINGDPIYGELSMLFLLELSSMPVMAEQLAIDGVLGHIASANITSYLRRGNVGPFADSAGLQRCYSLWVRGILPFLLNLLDAVQASIAGEVAIFLNQFPALLEQASRAFESPETNRLLAKGQTKFITLSTCSEVHSLALITYILNGFRQGHRGTMEIVDVPWDSAGVHENVEFWLGSRALLKERLVPMSERDVEWSKRRAADGNISFLEEKVVGELLGIRGMLNNGD